MLDQQVDIELDEKLFTADECLTHFNKDIEHILWSTIRSTTPFFKDPNILRRT